MHRQKLPTVTGPFPLSRLTGAVALLLVGMGQPALAMDLDTGDQGFKARWDNTFKLSTLYRLKRQDERITVGDVVPGPNFLSPGSEMDDGDRNFNRGFVSQRLDWLSELDVSYRNFGSRLSGAAWYDAVYNRSNDNTSQDTINSTSVPAGEFTHATRTLMGRKAEFLDAFVYYKSGQDAEHPLTVRLGRHSLIYGESLFFGANGIANAQSPIDLIKLLTVPGSQFKEVIRPVGQLSAQLQVNDTVAVGGYYQYKWEKTRIPASGSYLNDVDLVGDGAESLLPHAVGAPLAMQRTADLKAKNSGQGGMQIRFRPGAGDVEYGLYAAVYHDKIQQIQMSPLAYGGNGTYRLVYPEGVKVWGASASTVFGEANVAGEISFRSNAPLVSAPQIDTQLSADKNSGNPFYAVGRTAHAQVSTIFLLKDSPLWDGASFLGEIAYNTVTKIDLNPDAVDTNVTRTAVALRMLFEPQYFQVLPGMDLTVPIGWGYNPYGNSMAIGKFNGGVKHGGDFSIGLTADYQKRVKATLTYAHFYGPANAYLTPNTHHEIAALYMTTGAQSLRDRDFISCSVQMSF